jgi:hypothetical protein
VDAQLDTKVRNMIRAAGYRDQDIYSLTPWDANDLRGTVLPVTRADLGRYRLLVWHIEGAAGSLGNGRTALVNAIGCGGTWLTRYLQTGGALWVFGNHALAGLTPRSRGVNEGACSGNLGNDHLTGIEMDSTSFLCTFMGICGGDFRQVRTETSKTDGLLSVTPTDYGVAASLPRLEADSTAYNYAALGGIRYVDAAFAPIFGPEGLEPLYTMNPVRSTSRFKDRTLAWRYADPDPVPEHGAMAVFLFSLHEMKQGSAVDGTGVLGMARSLGDWFRRHLPPHGDPS